MAIPEVKVKVGADTSELEGGLARAQASLRNFGTQLRNIGAVATGVGAGLAAALKSSVNRADELAKVAQKIGVPVEELSQLEHVANLSGVSLGDLQIGLAQLSRKMVEGGDIFTDFGVSLRDAEGVMRPTSEVLADLADVLSQMPDGAEKTAAAMELLGRSGANMIPMLNAGAAGIAEGMAEADALGQTVTQGMGKEAEALNDNLSRLQTTLAGLSSQMATELVPVINSILEPIVGLARAFGKLSPEMREFSAMIAAGFMVGGPVLLALGAMTIAVSALSAPMLIAVGAVTALTAGLVALWPSITQSARAIEDFATSTVASITGFIDDTAAAIAGIPDFFRQLGTDIIQGLGQGIDDAWGAVVASIKEKVGWLPDWVKTRLGIQSPSRVFAEIGQFIMKGLTSGLEAGEVDLKKKTEEIFGAVIRGSMRARDALRQLLSDMSRSASNKFFKTVAGAAFGALKIPGFEGGGFTGSGPRTGGLDGRGGFPAILHPNETVIDHTRGQAMHQSGVVIHQTINISTGVQQTVRAEIRSMLPQIAEVSKAAVLDARRRGGNYSAAFG